MSAFFNKYSDRILPEPNSGCWFWMGEINWAGYGRAQVGRRRIVAHRISYTMDVGAIPEGLQLDHLCRVRCCCNPEHLEPVTRSVNILRAVRSIKSLDAREFCRRGHRLSDEHNYRHPKGSTVCRKCKRITHRKSRQVVQSDGSLRPSVIIKPGRAA